MYFYLIFILDIFMNILYASRSILRILPSHYVRRCSHDSPSRFLFSYLTLAHARTYKYNCAKRDYKRRNRRTRAGRFSKGCACIATKIFLHLSVVAAACKLSTCSMQNLGADNRYDDILLLHDAKIKSYI